jgi:hypothetical protein
MGLGGDRLCSRKWRECWKRDREEEVVLAALQEMLSESQVKSQIAQRRRMGRRSRR